MQGMSCKLGTKVVKVETGKAVVEISFPRLLFFGEVYLKILY